MPLSESNSIQKSLNLDVVILQKLKTGCVEGIEKEISEYLSPVISGQIEDAKKHGIFTVQFLHLAIKSPGNICTGLLEAVELCYKCYKKIRNQVQLTEALAVPKLLYHILTKLPVKGFHQWRVSLCSFLYDELSGALDENRDTRNTIVNSTHSHVWNLTVKQEQAMEVSDWEILQLRHVALKILLLKDGAVTSAIDKLVLVLTRYEKSASQKNILSELEFPVVDLVANVLTFLQGNQLLEEEKLSPLSLIQFLFRYGIMYNIKKAVEVGIASSASWKENYSKDTETQNIFQLFLCVGHQLIHWTNQNSTNCKNNQKKNSKTSETDCNGETLPTLVKLIPHDKLYIVTELFLIVVRYIDKNNLHTEELIHLYQSYAKVNYILLTWKPTQDKQCRMLIDLMQTQMKILFEYIKNCSDDEFCKLIQICEEMTKTYDTILSNDKMSAKDQDRHYCGYLMSKLAHMCFEKEMLQLAISFYQVACSQLTKFVNSENSLRQSRLDEVSLSKVYIRLAEAYLKCGQTTVAMDTIVSSMLIDNKDLLPAMLFWVKLKKEMMKSGDKDILKKTLGQCVLEQDNSVDVCRILQSEYTTFKSNRKRYYEAEVEILLQIIDVANEPFDKGKAMLEMALVFWQSGLKDDSVIVDYLKQSEEVLGTSQDTSEIMGQVKLWHYIVNNEDFCRQILTSMNIPHEAPVAEPGEESDTPMIDKSVYMNVAKEVEAIEQLDQAVALWETIGDDVRDVSLLLQSIMICSRIYQLLNKPDKQLQVLKIYHHLSMKHYTKVTMDAMSHMIECLLSVDMVTEAEKFINWDDNSDDKQSNKEETIYYQIAKSHFLLFDEKYDEGMSILRDILSVITQKQNSTWSMFVLEGRAKRLMSQYLTLPDHVTNEYCLDYACEAVRFHTGVVHFLMGKEYLSDKIEVKKGKSVDKWTALFEILESLYNLGCLYSHIGEAREAKCYLKEGWKVARYYGLPAWNVKFSSEMVKLHCKSEKNDEAVSSLLEISHVLPCPEELLPLDTNVPVPQCVNHILTQKYCNYCHENLKFVLQMVPIVAGTYGILNEEKSAVEMLERSCEVIEQLVKTNTKKCTKEDSLVKIDHGNFQLLYLEVLTQLADLYLNLDQQRCQEYLEKASVISAYVKNGKQLLLMLQFKLCKVLCSFNWQSLQNSSSNCDEEEKENKDDFSDSLPVVNLTKKFETMSVNVKEQIEKTNDQSQNKACDKEVETQDVKHTDDADFMDLKDDDALNIAKTVKNSTNRGKIARKNVKEPRGRKTSSNNEKADIDIDTNVEKAEKLHKKDNSAIHMNKIEKKRRNSRPKSKETTEALPMEENVMETPIKQFSKLAMKTPRSVCSRKAILDLMLDSDEDDVQPIKSRKKAQTTNKKQPLKKNNKDNLIKPDVYEFSDDEAPSCERKGGQSKIPRPIPQKSLFGNGKGDNLVKAPKQKATRTRKGTLRKNETEAARDDGTCEDSEEVKFEDIDVPLDDSIVDSESALKTESQELVPARNARGQRSRLTRNDNKSSVEKKAEKRNEMENNVNESDKENQIRSKVKSTKRVLRSKVNATERARSESDSEEDKQFTLDDSLSVKDDESVISDTYHSEEPKMYVRSRLETEDYDNPVIQEVTEIDCSLDDSIELLRGDNKAAKGTRKGRTKKASKDVEGAGKQQAEDDDDGDQQTGETTEVLRSSKLLRKSHAKPDKIMKMEPVPKTESQISSTNSRLIQTLEEAYKQMKHLPSPPVYTSICQMLALQYMELSPLKAAFYLAESVAVTFRHQSLINAARKIRKSTKTNDSSVTMETATDVESLQTSREILHFNKTEQDFQEMMTQIPEDWSVCQLSVVSQSTPAMMILSRVDRSGQPILVQLPGFKTEQGRQILTEFTSIINESKDSVKVTDKNEWWKWRGSLDTRMQTLLENIEKYWLGRWKFLLLGHPIDIDGKELSKMVECVHSKLSEKKNKPVNKELIKLLLQSGDILSDSQLTQALSDLSNSEKLSEVSKDIKQFWSKHVPTDTRRHHVILLLDKTLQHLPWESIPILRSHSLSRLPSLYHMISYLSQKGGVSSCQSQKVGVSVIDKQNVYYVLNPDNNLPSTQETFQQWFEKNKGWQGIVGKPPSAEENKKALTEYDLLVYCGHGTGSKYLSGDDLQQLKCRAAVFLMGCSSGQLQTRGQLEASGMMLNYFLANCPCIISNLWDVTDKDIDRFLEHLLQSSLSQKSCDVLSLIPSSRNACRLPFLIGAAPVVYGFPIIIN